MARGWESKSVEAQQMEASNKSPMPGAKSSARNRPPKLGKRLSFHCLENRWSLSFCIFY